MLYPLSYERVMCAARGFATPLRRLGGVEAGASHIVTGDRHLLDLGSYEGAQIVTPARFLAHLAIEPR